MAQPEKATPPALTAVKVGGLFDSTDKISSTHTSELVIALCGPVGSPVHDVAETIKATLDSTFGYESCEIVRLSKFIEEHAPLKPGLSAFERINALINAGNDLRGKHGGNVLAELAVNKIRVEREKHKEKSESKRYEPRRVCHIIDSIKNQEELDLLRTIYRDMLYVVGVFAPLDKREANLRKRGMENSQVYALVDRDSGEESANGQTVRDTFPQSDFFLRVEEGTDSQLERRVERFLHLILGTRIITPTPAETAMYAASSAAGNSACLSRQVGAAIASEDGEVLAVGWNDVPRAGGGLYGSDLANDPNHEKDKRCWNREGGKCFNDEEKSLLAEAVAQSLVDAEIVAKDDKDRYVKAIERNAKLRNIIEFSRSIHAEMHALINAGKTSGQRLGNSKMFVTTYPCHSCARHIVAAGIMEVYYIEPYRKSLATKLHEDAVTESEQGAPDKVRILPYDGVAPAKYLTLFRMKPDSRKKSGKMIKIAPKDAMPKMEKSLEALPALESIVVKSLASKGLIAGESNG